MPINLTSPALDFATGQIEDLHLSLRKLVKEIPTRDVRADELGPGEAQMVRKVQAAFRLDATGDVDAATAAAVTAAASVASAPAGASGRVYLEDGRAAAGLTLRLYGRGFGGSEQRLGEAVADGEGFYAIGHQPDDRAQGFELRVVDAEGAELSLSDVIYEPASHLVVNAVAPAALVELGPEFERLSSGLRDQLENPAELGRARETAEQQDLTALSQATGWDARVLSLAAKAALVSEDTGLSQEALYGLFRAGLPTDRVSLAFVSEQAVEQALKATTEAGVIALDEQGVGAAREAFKRFADVARREAVAPGTLSPLGELLDSAPLGEADREAFSEALFASQGAADGKLWERARERGIGEEAVNGLRLQGKLAFLTLNNAPLERQLREQVGSLDRLDSLVDLGLHEPAAWEGMIREGAAGGPLDEAIPAAYKGEGADERLAAYAADMARKVRLSFPTRVTARRIEENEIQLPGEPAELGEEVGGLLRKASALGFELGRTPVHGFFADHGEALFGDQPAARVERTTRAVKTVQRLFQLTPSDDAMKVLLGNGFHSAREVHKIGHESFVERYGAQFRPYEAQLVSRRAEQIEAITYSFYGALKEIDKVPGAPVLGAPAAAAAEAKSSLIEHYPTLEGLFGSLDFCECDQCQSVLSPAAYLVDLLQLLDREESDWNSFTTDWALKHGGEAYADKYKRPFDALVARRPDLPHLQLDCENTNTELPYIDLVNEILEAAIADDQPLAHDTGSASTEELLAEPQHTDARAYAELQRVHYPLGLPFDLWTESVRAFCAQLRAPLWQVLEAFRQTDELTPPGNEARYGRAAVFAERLGLTPAERALLTAADLDASWHQLYGFASAAEALAGLGSAQSLCRRLGITPKELIEIVTSRFINPGLDAPDETVVLVTPDVGCDFDQTVLRYADGRAADPDLLLRVNVLVRLQRKLGWSIAEVDQALGAFVPRDLRPLTAANLGRALETALTYMSHLEQLREQLELGAEARAQLLVFWAPLPTAGERSLYARLFLTPSMLEADGAFDDPLGDYLSRPDVPVRDHLAALQGALGLSAGDLELILAEDGASLATATLSLDLVSSLYRHRVLAKALGLSVAELIALKQMSGLDPFAPLPAQPLSEIAADGPFVATLRFVEVAALIRDSGFSVEELQWLLRDRVDPGGPHRPDPGPLLSLLVGLAADIDRVRAEHTVPDDPATFTDALVGQKLALLYPPSLVESFLVAWKAALARPVADAAEGPPALAPEDVAGLLPQADFEALFTPLEAGLSDHEWQRQTLARRARLAELLIAFLQRRLSRQLVLERLAAEFDAEPALIEALAGDARLLQEPGKPGSPLVEAFLAGSEHGVTAAFFGSNDGSGDPLSPATVSAVDTALGPEGAASARFEGYLQVPAAGEYRFTAAIDGAGATVELRFDHLAEPVVIPVGQPSPPLQLAAGTPYGFAVDVHGAAGGGARLFVQGGGVAKQGLGSLSRLARAGVERASRAHGLLAKTLRLADGLCLSERELRHLTGQSEDFAGFDLNALPTGPADDSPAAAQARCAAFLRVAEYAALKRDLALGGDELIAIFERAERTQPATVGEAEARAALIDDVCGRFAALVRREPALVAEAAAQLGLGASSAVIDGARHTAAPGFRDDRGLRRIWEALRLAELLGAPTAAVASWTGIVAAAPAEQATIAAAVRDAARSACGLDAWPQVAKPIFDGLRARQRSALTALIMHRQGFDRLEQLYEHFLVDPGMEPVVQTSRIQLAIAAVQLFISRCLMNLEPQVPPAAIVSQRWEWMKRYREWEANRRIFLFPENWLEPEFRDDKSHLFKALESALLQEELTDERVEEAFFAYLQGLEQIARLEIVSSYVEEHPEDPASNVLHVIGRTHNSPHRYFWRRYAHRSWMPWEPIEAEIEGDHVAAAIWRGRLHVLWVTFLEQGTSAQQSGMTIEEMAEQPADSPPGASVQAQLHWVERFQEKWTTRQAGAFGDSVQIPLGASFVAKETPIYISKEHPPDGTEGALRVNLGGWLNQSFRIANKNSPPVSHAGAPPAPLIPYVSMVPGSEEDLAPAGMAPRPTGYAATGEGLWVGYTQEIELTEGEESSRTEVTEPIVDSPGFELRPPSQALQPGAAGQGAAEIASLVTPFFFLDEHNTFYVEPRLTEKTIDGWEHWSYPIIPTQPRTVDPGVIGRLLRPVIPEVELAVPFRPPGPGPDPDPIGPVAKFQLEPHVDWLTRPGAVVEFDGVLVGAQGGVGSGLAAAFKAGEPA